MTPRKRRRLYFAIALVCAGATGAALVVRALQDNVLYFYSPSDIEAKHVPVNISFRIGGLVQQGSVARGPRRRSPVRCDGRPETVPVSYSGALPDLFREGQGVVASGALGQDRTFRASEILAKHDERYMPPEVVQALKRAGRWREGGYPNHVDGRQSLKP